MDGSTNSLQTLGIVGAGPMGAGIAQIGLTAGLEVILFDLDADATASAADDIHKRILRLEEKGQLPQGFSEQAKHRLHLADSLSALAACEAVIEAVVERLDIKQSLFAKLEAIVAPDTMLATNTSSLSVAAIAAQCVHKGRVCGLHFFNPVPLMKLVEVVVAPSTTPETVAFATSVSKQIGKVPVTVGDTPGFLVNLQGRAYILEALAIMQEGVADPATIDRIMRDGAGFRMGPFELMDLTGIDVNYAASRYIYEGYQHDPRLRTTPLHQLMASAGFLGRKTGRGFHDYGEGKSPPSRPSERTHDVVLRPHLIGSDADWDLIRRTSNFETGDDLTLIALVGEDCATACARLMLDPTRTVAVDLTMAGNRHLTVMAAVGGISAAEKVAGWLREMGFAVELVQDSPAFVLPRILAMVANLGCELAQIGVASPEDIDLAMKLAQNYPKGPLEWAEWLGVGKVHEIMTQLQAITGSDRYRPSLWLRRRAQLGLSVYQQA